MGSLVAFLPPGEPVAHTPHLGRASTQPPPQAAEPPDPERAGSRAVPSWAAGAPSALGAAARCPDSSSQPPAMKPVLNHRFHRRAGGWNRHNSGADGESGQKHQGPTHCRRAQNRVQQTCSWPNPAADSTKLFKPCADRLSHQRLAWPDRCSGWQLQQHMR